MFNKMFLIFICIYFTVSSGVFCSERSDASNKCVHNCTHNDSYSTGTYTCTQHTGAVGTCRNTSSCIRQHPKQKMWRVCGEWPDRRTVPSELCCYSDAQLRERLLNETNSDKDFYEVSDNNSNETMVEDVSDEEDMVREDRHRNKCGISSIVSRILAIDVYKKRSQNEQEFYDQLFPVAYRIVMGNSVRVGQIPWMCSIYYQGHFICGGSIIDRKHILTAAHCFDNTGRNANEYYIRAGSVLLYNGTLLRVSRITIHEEYVIPRIYHDIAIIRVVNEIPFTPEVSPICLPRKGLPLKKSDIYGKIAFVSGFGDISFGGEQASVLQEVDLKVVNNSYCERNYNILAESRSKFPVGMKRSLVCAGHEGGGKDACQGDSGGPLTVPIDCISYLIGIVSFGFKCARAHFPGVYTYVPYYMDWVMKRVNEK